MVKAHNGSLHRKDEPAHKTTDLTTLFNHFIKAETCNQTFSAFLNLCESVGLRYPPPSFDPNHRDSHLSFYPRLRKKLSSLWKATQWWKKLDHRYYGKEYFMDPKSHKSGGYRAGTDMKVLIIGAGPCGLRTAIEMACLGAKVIVVEKRDTFSRNNVLHLWPFIITDLKTLGAKKLYGRFCAGAIDHISIRQLQLILLKIALVLGVEVVVNVSFEALVPPTPPNIDDGIDEKGWSAAINPANHPVSKFEFDMVIGADGKRNTLQGFKRKEFRGKLAIGLTVNFINRNTTAEAKVEEISGVAYIFNQEFFKNLQRDTGIDLENIVYYKGETHYFVMTAKKHSLVSKGVLIQDYDDTAKLLSYDNVDKEAMMRYAREAADFSTLRQLPTLDFAINQYGEPDVALFDFTCMYAAENAALCKKVNHRQLITCLVGDSLLEPFWPMGTGCARGFLAAFDTVWMAKQWAVKKNDPNLSDDDAILTVLSERESLYRLLHQTTPQNTVKNISNYTIDPDSRYVIWNKKAVTPNQAKTFYITDDVVDDSTNETLENELDNASPSLTRQVSIVRSNKLLAWCRRITYGYEGVFVRDMADSWRSGLALCAIIHQFRPDLINWNDLDPNAVEKNNQMVFGIAEKQLGISPIMTAREMSSCETVDNLLMVTYISQFYEMFKHETPTGIPPRRRNDGSVTEDNPRRGSDDGEMGPKPQPSLSLTSPVGLLTRLTQHIKKKNHQPKHEHGDHHHHHRKKKFASTKKKDNNQSTESAVFDDKENSENAQTINVKGVEVTLRQQDGSKPNVHQRASNRISALSNQLISQWEQNAPQTSPRTPSKKPVEFTTASDKCYFCDRRVYIVERLSAEGLFFHRQCFVCSNCGLTLRRGAYQYDRKSGKFFCHFQCLAQFNASAPPKSSSVDHEEARDGLAPLPKEVVKSNLKERSYRTPERIELENIRRSMIENPKEVTEEVLTQHNLSGHFNADESALDENDMSDSSDDDVDWEAVLKDAVNEENYEKMSSTDWSSNDASSESSPEESDSSESSSVDVLPLEVSKDNKNFEDAPKIDKSPSFSSSSSLAEEEEEKEKSFPDSSCNEEVKTTLKQEATAEELSEQTNKEVIKVEESRRDSLSSLSTSSDITEGELVINAPSSRSDHDEDEKTPTSPAHNIASEPGIPEPVNKVEEEKVAPVKKPRTVFNVLTGDAEDKDSKNDVEKSSVDQTTTKETSAPDVTASKKKELRHFDTLDRVQQYLITTPVNISTDTKRVLTSIEDSDDESITSSVSLSSATSDSNTSDADTSEFDVLDLLDEKPSTTPSAVPMVIKETEDILTQESPPTLKESSTPVGKVRMLPRQSSVDSILIKASNAAKRNTAVSKDKDENLTSDLEATKRDLATTSFDETLISDYVPCRSSNTTTTSDVIAEPRPPLERRLSYDSLERRMKNRLRARNRWLREESRTGRSLSRSQSDRDSQRHSFPTEGFDVPDTKPLVSPLNVVIVESSPPIASPLTPTAPPEIDYSGESDQFFTPRGPSSTLYREEISQSPEKGTVVRTLTLDESDYILAPTSPSAPPPSLQLDPAANATSAPPSDPSKSKETESPPKRVLPALPKVPHLEAISPTGSANNTLTRKKRLSVEEDFKAREERVKERVAKIKAQTLKKKQNSDSQSTDDQSQTVGIVEPTYSGKSPVLNHRPFFRKKGKRDKKSKSNTDGNNEYRIKRALPVPLINPISTSSQEAENQHDNNEQTDAVRNPALTADGEKKEQDKSKRTKHFFRISPRKKHKKAKDSTSAAEVDGVSTLDRRYRSRTEREQAILRGERFRVLPEPPSDRKKSTDSNLDFDHFNEEDPQRRLTRKNRSTLAGLTPAQIDAKITRRVQLAARVQAKMEAQKRLRRAQVIQRQLEEVEVKQKRLEERGVFLEKALRADGGGSGRDDSKKMQAWFQLVQEKNGLLRYENELMIYQRELQLEDIQSRLQQDLRERMAMDDKRKTKEELAQEKEILQKMLDVVEQRDELVALLEEQRLKEHNEDVDPETFMLNKLSNFSDEGFKSEQVQTPR